MRIVVLAFSLLVMASLGVAQAQNAPNPRPSPAGQQCQQKCYSEEKACEARLPNPATTTQYYACTNAYASCMTACPP